MHYNDHTDLFRVTDFGTSDAENIKLPTSGTVCACVIGGEIGLESRGNAVFYTKGTFLIKQLDGSSAFFGDGRVAYFVADGLICDQVRAVNGIGEGFSVTVAGASEDVFKMCELAEQKGENAAEMAFIFHRLIRNASEAKLQEEKRRVDTALLLKEYIDCHAAGRLSLDEISKVFFISKTQIFRIFKSCFGIPPMQYFLQKKIDVSKKMLEDNMRVSDIAETLGFSDAKHYSKTFKRFVGMLPREYRKEKRLQILHGNDLTEGK
jgi:AraC-like DNA-binding protein